MGVIGVVLNATITIAIGLPVIWGFRRWEKRRRRQNAEKIATLWDEGRKAEAIGLLLSLM